MDCSSQFCSQTRSGTLDYHLFGPVKDILSGRHSADKELKESFRDVLRRRGKQFYNVTKRLTQRRQTVLQMTETLWENSLIIANDV